MKIFQYPIHKKYRYHYLMTAITITLRDPIGLYHLYFLPEGGIYPSKRYKIDEMAQYRSLRVK